MELILASASPRRERLLRELGLRFQVIVPADVQEQLGGAAPDVLVTDNARRKAVAVAGQHPQALVIGADTVVVLAGTIFGKPRDAKEAAEMLRQLAGRVHEVFTGVCLLQSARSVNLAFAERTRVWMRSLTSAAIRDYIVTTQPLDKAGAYAIQETGTNVVERIEGSYSNVMGLPVERLAETLVGLGMPPAGPRGRFCRR